MRKLYYLGLCLFLSLNLQGQESATDTDIYLSYKTGIDLYHNKLYGPAKVEMEKFQHQDIHLISEKHRQYLLEAEKIILQSDLHLNLAGSEKSLADFVEYRSPDPIIKEPSLILGSYYYNDKQYEQSIYYYDKVDFSTLEGSSLYEASFKKGYAHFVLKDFARAKQYFISSRASKDQYLDPSNYYLGMCAYFQEDFDEAIRSFDKVGSPSNYSIYIPYYVTQIYFAQGNYDGLIPYGEKSLNQPNLQNRKEIRLLLGQAYFKQGNYEKALPHLEYYESNTQKLTQEEFYQLAFTQYQLKLYGKAADNFKELALLDTKLGQLVNYYLADCYINLQDYPSARTAFKKVSQMSYEPRMTEEALFNYGKLSAQLNYERESINTLVKIEETSTYYSASRMIINDILLNSGDYENSISILESIGNLTPDLKATYQQITYNRAIQLFNEGNMGDSRKMFAKSDKYQLNESTYLNTRFWLAYMLSNEAKTGESIIAFDDYLDLSNGKGPFPDESSPTMAHYIQGYNYLKIKEYAKAEIHFKNSIVGININQGSIRNDYISQRVLLDAMLRSGDCLFKQNKYEEAITFYRQAIQKDKAGSTYALYQKGIIEGLLNKPYEKIISLEEIVENYPSSDYADDALYQLGDTYLNLGTSGKALTSFNTIITNYKGRSPLINPSLLKLGLISYNQGDADTALKYYKQIFTNNPSSEESQQALIAIEEIYIDDQGKTEEYFNFVNTIPGYELSDLTRDSLTYQIAESQYEDAEYEKAIISFNKYLKSYASGLFNLEARYFRGECYSILKLYKEASEDYEYLIGKGYNDYYMRSLRKAAIIAYNFHQEFEKSYTLYKTLSETSRDEDIVYESQMGALRSAFRTSNHEGVLSFAPKVISSPIANLEDFSSAYYYLGKASLATGQPEQALIAFSEINNNRNNQAAEANFLIAKIYFDRNDLDLAEQQINFAIQNSNNYPYWVAKTLLLYGDVYYQRNDLFNARAVIEAVIENYTGNEEIIKLAQEKLQFIEQKEAELNRIKSTEGKRLEMDTIGNG